MSPEAQRIAIAEACGKVCSSCNNSGFLPKWSKVDYDRILALGVKGPAKQPRIPCDHAGKLPDYLDDLNAMHEAEKVLTDEQIVRYDRLLNEVCAGYDWHAEASDKAEAFLRTIGKWSTPTAPLNDGKEKG